MASRKDSYIKKSLYITEIFMTITNSLVILQPGMYILRHPKGGLPPLSVSRAPGSPACNGKLEILSTPMTYGTVLRGGSDCIVMLVLEAPVELLVTAYPTKAGAVVPAIKIDQIGLDSEAAPSSETGKQIAISGKGLSIIGHIERTGDAVASEGECLGDASGNLRLEGFQIMWPDRPEGIDLAYNVVLEGVGATPPVNTGKFCGTKNEARRITEVTFTLHGSLAKQFQLEGSVYFSGGFQTPVSSGMPLSGPSGLEHLTSISLRAIPSTQPEEKEKNPWDESQQTQVFKAKTSAAKKADPKKPPTKAIKAVKTK